MAIIPANDQNFNELLKDNKHVVVKYFATWCGSCKLFFPKYRRLADDDRFEGVVFLNVNSEENPEARKVAGVDNLPFFATFLDGQLIKAEATSKEDNVVAMIEQLKNS